MFWQMRASLSANIAAAALLKNKKYKTGKRVNASSKWNLLKVRIASLFKKRMRKSQPTIAKIN